MAGRHRNDAETETVVIPREEAVFWLDSRGYWRNSAGRFRKKKINDHFHASISKDEGGYFVAQQKGNVREKVYFPHEDTALFVFDLVFHPDGITLVLNTGRRMELNPENLYSRKDCLYLREEGDTIKFSERALLKLSDALSEEEGKLFISCGGRKHLVPEYE